MRRMLSFALLMVACVEVFANPQTTKPQPPSSTAERLTTKQADAVGIFLEGILWYVDNKTRTDLASSTNPTCLPQWPVIKLSYRAQEIPAEQWRILRQTARRAAPAVRLVGPADTTSGAYVIDITEVREGKPLSSIAYNHSKILTFPSEMSQPWFGAQDVPVQSKKGVDEPLIASEALINESSVIALSRGHLTISLWEKHEDLKDQVVLGEIAEAIAAFHTKVGEKPPQSSSQLPYYSESVTPIGRQDNIKLVFARRSISSGYVGGEFDYILTKKETGWEVVDANRTSFSDTNAVWWCEEK